MTTTTTRCIYCGNDIAIDRAPSVPTAPNARITAPDVDDDASWDALAKQHDRDCGWIATRAHRRPIPYPHRNSVSMTLDQMLAAGLLSYAPAWVHPSYPRVQPQPGACEIREWRGRSEPSDRRLAVGVTVHVTGQWTRDGYDHLLRHDGGGPDRRYYTVLASCLVPPVHRFAADRDVYEEFAWVRAATDAEAASAAAADAEP